MIIKKSIIVSSSWLSPWLFVPSILISKFRDINLSIKTLIFSIGIILLLSLSALISLNFSYLINISLLILLLFHGDKILSTNKHPEILKFGVAYILVGTIFGVSLYSSGIERVGMYGGEVNFSGFMMICIFCLALKLDKYRVVCIFLLFLNMYIGGSRSLLLFTIISCFYYHFRHYKFLLLCLTAMQFFIIMNAAIVLDYLLSLNLIAESGYIEDSSRLLVLADSSTRERILVSEFWQSHWVNSIQSFFFGVTNYEELFKDILLHPHNSLIQKGSQYGAIFVCIFVIYVYKYLPVWFGSIILLYGLFLHSVWSVPLVMFFAYIIGRRGYGY